MIHIKDIKKGDIFWESCSMGNIEYEALSDSEHEFGIDNIDRWRCKVKYYKGELTIMESSMYKLDLYKFPQYIGVYSYYLNGCHGIMDIDGNLHRKA